MKIIAILAMTALFTPLGAATADTEIAPTAIVQVSGSAGIVIP